MTDKPDDDDELLPVEAEPVAEVTPKAGKPAAPVYQAAEKAAAPRKPLTPAERRSNVQTAVILIVLVVLVILGCWKAIDLLVWWYRAIYE